MIKWWDRVVALGGHRSIEVGRLDLTVYAFETAMHGAINVRTRWGVLCVAMPWLGGIRSWPAYAYLSPNATPWAATWGVGGEWSRDERRMMRVRRVLWGHGYDEEVCDPQVLERAVAMAEWMDDAVTRPAVEIVRERREWGRGRAAREWSAA